MLIHIKMFSKFTQKITYSMDWFYLRNDEFDIWFKEILRRTFVVDVKYGNFLGLDVAVTGVLAPSFDRCQTTTRTPHMPEAPQSIADTQFQCWSFAVGFYKWGSPSAKRGPGVAHQLSSWRWLENFFSVSRLSATLSVSVTASWSCTGNSHVAFLISLAAITFWYCKVWFLSKPAFLDSSIDACAGG